MAESTHPWVRARLAHRARDIAFSRLARPVRFAITGGLAGLMQLALLKLLTDYGWQALVANVVAFLLAAQLNFALSSLFTWRDRGAGRSLGRRWLAFHGSIASMAAVNLAAFAAARLALPDLVASASGICAAATGNFFIGDRLVFRSGRSYDDLDRRIRGSRWHGRESMPA
jgi:putative flippase GtrA